MAAGCATVGEGFGAGGFEGDGTDGGGSASGLAVREGVGTDGALRLLFAFAFSLLLAFALALPFSTGDGWNSALALAFALTFVSGLIVPPEGIPCSFFPVAGDAAIAGWLFGSEANVCVWLVLLLFVLLVSDSRVTA